MQISRDVVVLDTGVEANFCNLGFNFGPDMYGLGLQGLVLNIFEARRKQVNLRIWLVIVS